MTFDDYQKATGKTAIYPTPEVQGNKAPWIYPAMLLASEQGEILSILQKVVRDNKGIIPNEKHDLLIKEVGDCLWALAQICSSINVSFDECADVNLKKLASRMERGVIGGSGDNR